MYYRCFSRGGGGVLTYQKNKIRTCGARPILSKNPRKGFLGIFKGFQKIFKDFENSQNLSKLFEEFQRFSKTLKKS